MQLVVALFGEKCFCAGAKTQHLHLTKTEARFFDATSFSHYFSEKNVKSKSLVAAILLQSNQKSESNLVWNNRDGELSQISLCLGSLQHYVLILFIFFIIIFSFFSFNPVLLSKCFLSSYISFHHFFFFLLSCHFYSLSFCCSFVFIIFFFFSVYFMVFYFENLSYHFEKNGQQSIVKNILVDIAIIYNDNKCHPVQYQYYSYFIDIDSNLKIICIVVLYDSITEYSPTINVT